MEKIILFPGDITYSFFENEISFIKKNYEIVGIFGYSSNEKRAQEILDKYKLDKKCYFNIKINFFDIFIALISKKPKEYKEEMINILKSKNKVLKKNIYLFFYFVFANKIKNIVKKKKCFLNMTPILYSFWLTRGAYAVTYLNATVFNGSAKTYSRAHGYDLYEERNPLCYLPFRKHLAERLTNISFISKNGLEYFRKRVGDYSNLSISYLGTFNNGFRKQIFEKNSICILSCSSVVQVKRLDIMIDLLKSFDGIEIQWFHFGSGPLLEEILKKAERELTSTSVHFNFVGQIRNEDILLKMKEIDPDYFINTSDSEGIPVSIMEAISFGIPIIARNVGGISEIVNERNGIYYSLSNQEEIKSFIVDRLRNIEAYKEKCSYSRALWEECFSGNTNYTNYFEKL